METGELPGWMLRLRSLNGGEHLGTIKTGQATSNCAFDDDGKYLYITADDYLMRIKLK
jgi:sugar lactone lactonase YvrE